MTSGIQRAGCRAARVLGNACVRPKWTTGVALVDLRGRQDEDLVQTLLAMPMGLSLRFRARWSPSDAGVVTSRLAGRRPIGCLAGPQRDSESGDVVLRAVGVASDRRRRGVGRSLIHGIADFVTCQNLVAEADGDGARFCGRVGFTIRPAEAKDGRPRFRWVRPIPVAPADADVTQAFTFAEVQDPIRQCWSRETSDDSDDWSEQNPARGPCASTALLVRELRRGEILTANVILDGEGIEHHVWNRLPSGVSIDLSRASTDVANGSNNPRRANHSPLTALDTSFLPRECEHCSGNTSAIPGIAALGRCCGFRGSNVGPHGGYGASISKATALGLRRAVWMSVGHQHRSCERATLFPERLA